MLDALAQVLIVRPQPQQVLKRRRRILEVINLELRQPPGDHLGHDRAAALAAKPQQAPHQLLQRAGGPGRLGLLRVGLAERPDEEAMMGLALSFARDDNA